MTKTAVTEPGTVTFGGAPLALVESGWNRWSADGITLNLRCNVTWGATREGRTGDPVVGATPQEALDRLAAADRKEAIRETLTPGQRFARDMHTYFHIGARTRRYRKDVDLHHEIVRLGIEIVTDQFWCSERLVASVHPAFGALRSYDAHIATGRAGVRVSLYVNQLTPWQLLDLLAEMTDAGVAHTGGGERWLQELDKSLTYGTTNPITGYQPIIRTTPTA